MPPRRKAKSAAKNKKDSNKQQKAQSVEPTSPATSHNSAHQLPTHSGHEPGSARTHSREDPMEGPSIPSGPVFETPRIDMDEDQSDHAHHTPVEDQPSPEGKGKGRMKEATGASHLGPEAPTSRPASPADTTMQDEPLEPLRVLRNPSTRLTASSNQPTLPASSPLPTLALVMQRPEQTRADLKPPPEQSWDPLTVTIAPHNSMFREHHVTPYDTKVALTIPNGTTMVFGSLQQQVGLFTRAQVVFDDTPNWYAHKGIRIEFCEGVMEDFQTYLTNEAIVEPADDGQPPEDPWKDSANQNPNAGDHPAVASTQGTKAATHEGQLTDNNQAAAEVPWGISSSDKTKPTEEWLVAKGDAANVPWGISSSDKTKPTEEWLVAKGAEGGSVEAQASTPDLSRPDQSTPAAEPAEDTERMDLDPPVEQTQSSGDDASKDTTEQIEPRNETTTAGAETVPTEEPKQLEPIQSKKAFKSQRLMVYVRRIVYLWFDHAEPWPNAKAEEITDQTLKTPELEHIYYMMRQGSGEIVTRLKRDGRLSYFQADFLPFNCSFRNSFVYRQKSNDFNKFENPTLDELRPQEKERIDFLYNMSKLGRQNCTIRFLVRHDRPDSTDSKTKLACDRGSFVKDFTKYVMRCERIRDRSPLADIFTHRKAYGRFDNPTNIIPFPQRPQIDFKDRTVYDNDEECYIPQGLATIQELARRNALKLYRQSGELRLLRWQEGGEHTFGGLLRVPFEYDVRMEVDDRLDVDFLNDDGQPILLGWTGVVRYDLHIPGAIASDIPVMLFRPTNKTKDKKNPNTRVIFQSGNPLHIHDAATIVKKGLPDLQRFVEDGQPNKVMFTHREQTKPIQQQLAAFHEINPFNKDRDGYERPIATAFRPVKRGYGTMEESTYDLFEGISDETYARMVNGLNNEQVRAIESLRNCPSRIGIIEGAPGCGKTELNTRIIAACARDNIKVASVSSQNEIADTMALRVKQYLVSDGLEDCKVHRIYSDKTEQSFMGNIASPTRLGSLRYTPMEIDAEFVVAKFLQESAASMHSPTNATNDKRFKLKEMSVAWTILEDARLYNIMRSDYMSRPIRQSGLTMDVDDADSGNEGDASATDQTPKPTAQAQSSAAPGNLESDQAANFRDDFQNDRDFQHDRDEATQPEAEEVDHDPESQEGGRRPRRAKQPPKPPVELNEEEVSFFAKFSAIQRQQEPQDPEEDDYLRNVANLSGLLNAKFMGEEITEHATKGSNTLYKRCYAYALENKTAVYITTPYGMGVPAMRKTRIQVIIVEEAQHLISSHLDVLLAYYPDAFIILTGDKKQISAIPPPMDDDLQPNKAARVLQTNVLKKMGKQGRPAALLTLNQRSEPSLVRLQSDAFYDGTLLSGLHHQDFPLSRRFIKLCKRNGYNITLPYLFLNVSDSVEEKIGHTQSSQNTAETIAVSYVVEWLLRRFEPAQLCVLSAYQAQARQIQYHQRLVEIHQPDLVRDAQRFAAVTRTTISGAGGSEAEGAIMSFTRTGPLGFLFEPDKLLTAISRAKSFLVIVANFHKVRNFIAQKRREETPVGQLVSAIFTSGHMFDLTVPSAWKQGPLSAVDTRASQYNAEANARLEDLRQERRHRPAAPQAPPLQLEPIQSLMQMQQQREEELKNQHALHQEEDHNRDDTESQGPSVHEHADTDNRNNRDNAPASKPDTNSVTFQTETTANQSDVPVPNADSGEW